MPMRLYCVQDGLNHVKGCKAVEFSQHINGEIDLDVYKIIRADGYKSLSGKLE